MREDNKMFLFNIYHDLEVDDAVANPIQVVKFPIEDGNLTQDSSNILKRFYFFIIWQFSRS